MTLETVGARTFELLCISPADTTAVVQFLMRTEKTVIRDRASDRERGRVVEKNLAERHPLRARHRPAEEFTLHNADFNVVVVHDEKAPSLWARTVEPGTDRPIFAHRDGKKVYPLAEVDRERRTGSGWYVATPRTVLQRDYPRWQARIAARWGGGSRRESADDLRLRRHKRPAPGARRVRQPGVPAMRLEWQRAAPRRWR